VPAAQSVCNNNTVLEVPVTKELNGNAKLKENTLKSIKYHSVMFSNL